MRALFTLIVIIITSFNLFSTPYITFQYGERVSDGSHSVNEVTSCMISSDYGNRFLTTVCDWHNGLDAAIVEHDYLLALESGIVTKIFGEKSYQDENNYMESYEDTFEVENF